MRSLFVCMAAVGISVSAFFAVQEPRVVSDQRVLSEMTGGLTNRKCKSGDCYGRGECMKQAMVCQEGFCNDTCFIEGNGCWTADAICSGTCK